jgi:hypothetical protein
MSRVPSVRVAVPARNIPYLGRKAKSVQEIHRAEQEQEGSGVVSIPDLEKTLFVLLDVKLFSWYRYGTGTVHRRVCLPRVLEIFIYKKSTFLKEHLYNKYCINLIVGTGS